MIARLALLSLLSGAAGLPVPTPQQLAWQTEGIMALVHFNMATFVRDGDPGCSVSSWNQGINCSNPAVFNPAKLNVTQWVDSMKALGIKHSVLTAKHGCGFLLWDTKTSLPDGTPYGYAVKRPDRASFPRDVIVEYVAAMKANGIGVGFYYSTGNNFYLNRVGFKPAVGTPLPGMGRVTDEQYLQLVLAHVTELWTSYGPLAEVWFDHGYSDAIKDNITALLKEHQGAAAGFNGFGVAQSPVRWVGTESGTPTYPVWSTTDAHGAQAGGTGAADGEYFVPAAADTTLQAGDHWFFEDGLAIRSLKELIAVYHASVGQNCVLELDFAIDKTGNVHPTHAARYAEFGAWITACYGAPLATSAGAPLTLPAGKPADRFVLREDQTTGQRVRTYSVTCDGVAVAAGSSVGAKRIHLLSAPCSGTLAVAVTGVDPVLVEFSAFAPCPSA